MEQKAPDTEQIILPDFHLGKFVRQILRQRQISVKKFAPLIGITQRGVYNMFRRKSIKVSLLQKICVALNTDLFPYLCSSSGSPEAKMYKEKISHLEKEIERLATENSYLKEIVRLQKK